MKDFIDYQQQEIVKQFGLPKRLIQNQDKHMTATEVRQRYEVGEEIMGNLIDYTYNTLIRPLYYSLCRWYETYQGRKKINWYYTNNIKTM